MNEEEVEITECPKCTHKIPNFMAMELMSECRSLKAELERARETNQRLNKRCQKAESNIAKNRYYDVGWRIGVDYGKRKSLETETFAIRKAMQKQGAKISRLKAELKAEHERRL